MLNRLNDPCALEQWRAAKPPICAGIAFALQNSSGKAFSAIRRWAAFLEPP
jgi:hypothetical protein